MQFETQPQEIRVSANEVIGMKSRRDGGKTVATRKRRDCCVKFAPSIRLKEIQHINDLPDEEIRDTWYTLEEYAAMKNEIKLTLAMAKEGKLPHDDNTKFCMRGLECRTKAGTMLRKTNRWSSIEAVLYEQSRQFYQGSLASPEQLAKVYTDVTCRCGKAARRAGIQDAEQALDGSPRKHNKEIDSIIFRQ